LFVEEEGECSGGTCESAEGQMVEEDVEGEQVFGGHGEEDEKRDKRFRTGWPWIISRRSTGD